jgi:RNA polymerase sigma-70 factor, ECF subfamily
MADRAVPSAMVQLVADHHQELYRYAYRLSGSVPDAEDLTQQVFLIAGQKIDQVRDAGSVRGWLFTVLRNCYLKARGKRLALPIADFDCSAIPENVPEQPVDTRDLQEAIDSLGDEFKIVVLMFYFEHRSYREIAELLDIPPGTVMSRLARAKGHLRRRLTDGRAATAPAGQETQGPKSAIDRSTASRR